MYARRVIATFTFVIAVGGVSNGQDEEPLLADLFGGLDIDLKTLEGSGVGLDFNWDIWSDEVYGDALGSDYGLQGDVTAEGFLSLDSDADQSTPGVWSAQGDLFINFVTGEETVRDAEFNHWVNLGLTPIQIEADQDFDEVNYVATPYIQFTVPFGYKLSDGLQHLFGGLDQRVRPPIVRTGYSFVTDIEDEADDGAEDRFELDARYRLTMGGDTEFDVRYRHFDEKDSGKFDFSEFKLSRPIANDSRVFVKYTNGELPTSEGNTDSVSLGFTWGIAD